MFQWGLFLLELFLLLPHLLHLFAIQPFLFLVRDLCLFAFQLLVSPVPSGLFYVCTVFDFSDGVSMALSVTALSSSTLSTALVCLSTISMPYVRLLH